MTPPSPEIEADIHACDEGELHRLSGFRVMEFVLQRGVPHRLVPREHWESEEGMTIGAVAELRCQCGALHLISLGAAPQSCQCSRWFFYDGTDVWALLSPAAA